MGLLNESMHIKHMFSWIRYKYEYIRKHPNEFKQVGILLFVGTQGSGKTLSAVNYVYKLLEHYPHCKLVTNIQLKDYEIIDFDTFVSRNVELAELYCLEEMYQIYLEKNRVFPFVNNDDFKKYNNGDKGVVFLVDEISLYMNSLESKNINMDTMTEIAQQRKQRKHIVCTTQVFGRLAKPLREQFSYVILCKKIFGFLQCNKLIDRDSLEGDNSTGLSLKGVVKKKIFYFHSPVFYDRYDTYYKIEKTRFVGAEKQLNIQDSYLKLES